MLGINESTLGGADASTALCQEQTNVDGMFITTQFNTRSLLGSHSLSSGGQCRVLRAATFLDVLKVTKLNGPYMKLY